MQKVVSISLNGIAYQLEEPGYDRLRSYLERAEHRLKDSPDRAEVMADLEQAIGEKCARVLGSHKTVVNMAEVNQILEEMGPVETAEEKPASDGEPASAKTDTPNFTPPPHKRLYQIREGAMWSGVCNGIAAYLNVDVTWVRIATVVLTLLTHGFLLLVYIAMAFIVPVAASSEERAAAFGMPFSAEELISRAKKNAETFGRDYRWRREWRRQQRAWRRQWEHMNAQMRQTTGNVAPQMSETARALALVFMPIAAIVGAIVFVVWILAMFSLVTQQTIFGWHLPHGMPLWGGILILFAIYALIAGPMRALRHGAHSGQGYHAGWSFLHTLLWIGFVGLFFWVAYTYIPAVHVLLDQLMWAANLTVSTISETMT
jgi:phage shock protein PspC (stress-responsive transcriptional regulator)